MLSNRARGEPESSLKRSPSAQTSPALARSAMRSNSSGDTVASMRLALLIGNGTPGWLTTDASTVSSTAAASANPPVKHMPITPTPLPGARAARSAATARMKSVIGRCALIANARNSAETHSREMVLTA